MLPEALRVLSLPVGLLHDVGHVWALAHLDLRPGNEEPMRLFSVIALIISFVLIGFITDDTTWFYATLFLAVIAIADIILAISEGERE